MDFIEKAKIRIKHWIRHNTEHLEEYAAFACELETADKDESAHQIRNIFKLIEQSNLHLEKALNALDKSK